MLIIINRFIQRTKTIPLLHNCRPSRKIYSTIGGQDEFPFPHIERHEDKLQELLMKSRIREKNDSTYFYNAKEYLELNLHQSKIKSIYMKKALAVFLTNTKDYYFVQDDDRNHSVFVEKWNRMVHELSDDMEIDQKFWENLKIELKNIRYYNLVSLIKSIANLPKNSKDFEKLCDLLDEASIHTLNRFDKQNPGPHFQLCHAWFHTLAQLGLEDQHDWQYAAVRYPKEFVQKSAEVVDGFSSSEFLFLIFISGCYRTLPSLVTKKISSEAGFSDDKCMLSKSMEDKIVNDWASWNFLEKGIVCEALNKCNVVSEGGINDSLWSLLKQDFLNMSDDIVCDPYISPVIPFSSLLQTHRKFDQYEIQQIFCKFGPNLKHMRPDARIRLLTLIKPITHREQSSKIQWFMNQFVDTMRPDLKQSNTSFRDYELLVDAMYEVRFHRNISASSFFHDILDAIKDCEDADISTGRSLVHLVLGIARMGVIKDEIIDDLFQKVNRFQPFQVSESSDDLMYAGLRFLFSLRQVGYPPNYGQSFFPSRFGDNWESRYNSSLPTSVMSREFSSSYSKNVNALNELAQLDYLMELDFPKYSGTRMDWKLRAKLIKVNQNFANSDAGQFMYKEISKFFKPETIYFGPTLPLHRDSSDIVFCADSNLEAIQIPKYFRERLEMCINVTKVPRTISKDYTWHCIILPKENDLFQNEHLSGKLNQKVKHLVKLGYRVHVIKATKFKRWQEIGRLTEKDIVETFG